jgi:RNA polymerase sigma-70 factor (ECF subfamily)
MTSRARASGQLRIVPPPKQGAAAPSRSSPRLPPPALDDSELLTALRRGDGSAATALHDRVRPAVERAIRRLLGPRDRDHEDLAQQAMIEVVTSIDRFRGDCPIDGWASTVAAHVVYNHIRRRTTERRLFSALRLEDEEELPARSSGPGDLMRRSTLRRVLMHLDKIDSAKAWAYVLHDVCGYDLQEIAEITKSTVAAVQSRLVRGRRELRERIVADPELAFTMEGDGT